MSHFSSSHFLASHTLISNNDQQFSIYFDHGIIKMTRKNIIMRINVYPDFCFSLPFALRPGRHRHIRTHLYEHFLIKVKCQFSLFNMSVSTNCNFSHYVSDMKMEFYLMLQSDAALNVIVLVFLFKNF